jgi:hypothetical protein
MRSAFNNASRDRPAEKYTTNDYAREKTKEEAATARENVPPEFKAEPYQDDTPKAAKMSGAFNRAATPPDGETPSQNYGPDYRP